MPLQSKQCEYEGALRYPDKVTVGSLSLVARKGKPAILGALAPIKHAGNEPAAERARLVRKGRDLPRPRRRWVTRVRPAGLIALAAAAVAELQKCLLVCVGRVVVLVEVAAHGVLTDLPRIEQEKVRFMRGSPNPSDQTRATHLPRTNNVPLVFQIERSRLHCRRRETCQPPSRRTGASRGAAHTMPGRARNSDISASCSLRICSRSALREDESG